MNFSNTTVNLKPLDPNNWERWPIHDEGKEDWWWFEDVDIDYWYTLSEEQWISTFLLVVYWIGIILSRQYMKKREPLKNLQGILFVYNLLLSLFYFCFAYNFLILFSDELFTPGWIYRTLCLRKRLPKRVGFWTLTFIWSKGLELADTIFLILLKKPAPFFQVYHHSLMLFLPAETVRYGEPYVLWNGVINAIQHFVMYLYFAMKVLKIRMPRIAPKILLMLEVVQMILGLGSGLYTLHAIRNGEFCIRHPRSIFLYNFAYLTMLILVVHMAYGYFTKPKRVKAD